MERGDTAIKALAFRAEIKYSDPKLGRHSSM